MSDKPKLPPPRSTFVYGSSWDAVPKQVGWVLETVVLWSRFLLYPIYAIMLIEIVTLTVDFIKIILNTSVSEQLAEHTLQTLEMLDAAMIANLIWLISAGSYYVFINTGDTGRPRPRALQHVSAGLLKEKMASSLVGVSSVHLLQVFLQMKVMDGTINWVNLTGMVVLHLMFITGLIAFCWVNRQPHHNHPEPKAEPTTGKETHEPAH